MTFEERTALVASLFAVDPQTLGGVCLRSSASPLRQQWLQLLRDLLPPAAALRKIPCNIADSRLLGGLDLVATLSAKRPVVERGVLASANEGVVVVAMAERLPAHTAMLLCSVLERGEVHVSREGVLLRHPARIGIVALDEGVSEDESAPVCILDRCAFLLDFASLTPRSVLRAAHVRPQIDAARAMLPEVTIAMDYVQALCATAMTLGAGSVRVSTLAVHVARVLAALDGRVAVAQLDAESAGLLVLAPRSSTLPETQKDGRTTNAASPADATPPENPSVAKKEQLPDPERIQDLILAATQSAIPSGLLAQLKAQHVPVRLAGRSTTGRYGTSRKGGARGRPTGVVPASTQRSRFNVIETLRAAAPWQQLRGRGSGSEAPLQVRPEDLRVTRYKQRSRTLTIFAVDASGSSALNRLAETKGAAELLLADCYVRRDQVAVIAFRGRTAEVLLPPTRSLVRAKRSLSALPGGGGTPLAAAIDAAALMASLAQRRGESATVVMLTDGRGNVARDGRGSREAGQVDAMLAARTFAAAKISALFVDTSSRPSDVAREIARCMGGLYLPLPFADARSLSRLVGAANSQQRLSYDLRRK